MRLKVSFPQVSWYDDMVRPGWSKIRIWGKLFHYNDYCTWAWQWTKYDPSKDSPENKFKGYCLRLGYLYHDDGGFPVFGEMFTVKASDLGSKDYPIDIEIIREKDKTVWIGRYDGKRFFREIDVIIEGNWIQSPYFGGRDKAQYNHYIEIKRVR